MKLKYTICILLALTNAIHLRGDDEGKKVEEGKEEKDALEGANT